MSGWISITGASFTVKVNTSVSSQPRSSVTSTVIKLLPGALVLGVKVVFGSVGSANVPSAEV